VIGMNDSANYECLKAFEPEFLEAIRTHDLCKIETIYSICILCELESVQFIKSINKLVHYAKNVFYIDDDEIFTAIRNGYMNNGDFLCPLKNLTQ